MKSKNSCDNCKHFKKHYIKGKKNFIPLKFGHCLHFKNENKIIVACQFWEIRSAEKIMTMEKTLEDIAKDIDKLISMFKNN